MAEQELDGAEIARSLVDDGRLGSPQGMRPASLGNPMPMTLSSTKRAYCRVLMYGKAGRTRSAGTIAVQNVFREKIEELAPPTL